MGGSPTDLVKSVVCDQVRKRRGNWSCPQRDTKEYKENQRYSFKEAKISFFAPPPARITDLDERKKNGIIKAVSNR